MTELMAYQHQDGGANAEFRNRRTGNASPYATFHSTNVTSRREQRERLRRDRVIGHAVVGVAAFAVFVGFLPIVGSLGTFVVALAAFYVGLMSFTFAVSIGLGDPWGWTRDGGLSAPLTWSDRVVLAGVAWFRRRSAASVDTPPAGAVRVLAPEPPD
jgi:hypothetical protein